VALAAREKEETASHFRGTDPELAVVLHHDQPYVGKLRLMIAGSPYVGYIEPVGSSRRHIH
jgi:hypothetical protein